MTDRPAFSDIPQGSRTGFGYVHDPESEAFIAEPEGKPDLLEALKATVEAAKRGYAPVPRQPRPLKVPQRRTQTVHITLTVDIPGDLRAAADGALRREFPRGKWEITDAD